MKVKKVAKERWTVERHKLKLPDEKALEVGRLVLEWVGNPIGKFAVFDVQAVDGTMFTVKVERKT